MATCAFLRFGDLVRWHRTAAALSQEALAERAGASARAISDLERGVHQAPHLETVRLLADALGLGEQDRAGHLARGPPGGEFPRRHCANPSLATGSAATPSYAPDRPGGGDGSAVRPPGPRRCSPRDPHWSRQERGKPISALAVAAEAVRRYVEGVCFIDLSPITESDLVMPSIAAAFGLRATSDTSLQEAVIGYLRERRLLLALDNCEQVLGAASNIATQLAAGPHLPSWPPAARRSMCASSGSFPCRR